MRVEGQAVSHALNPPLPHGRAGFHQQEAWTPNVKIEVGPGLGIERLSDRRSTFTDA